METTILAKRRYALTGNYAAAYAAKAVDVDVVAIYPITPQTTIAEKLSEFVANGELDAELVHVESEHSAMSAAIGAAAVGARVFTATCSQGLELMHEMLFIASGLRLPIVMAVPARALSAPISIHSDYCDVVSARDSGWIVLIASNAQEVYDLIIQAFKIGEDKNVLLPVMVAYDGFLMSHTLEPVILEDDYEVRKFVPKEVNWITLNPEKPVTMGPLVGPDWYYEIKYQQVVAMRNALNVINKVGKDFDKKFGRRYGLLKTYRVEDAEYIIITYGAAWEFAMEAIDKARNDGVKIGGIGITSMRPFPEEEIVKILQDKKAFVTVDKALYFGISTSPVHMDILATLYKYDVRIPCINVVHGIGQRTMFVKDFVETIKMCVKVAEKGKPEKEIIYMGLRT